MLISGKSTNMLLTSTAAVLILIWYRRRRPLSEISHTFSLWNLLKFVNNIRLYCLYCRINEWFRREGRERSRVNWGRFLILFCRDWRKMRTNLNRILEVLVKIWNWEELETWALKASSILSCTNRLVVS